MKVAHDCRTSEKGDPLRDLLRRAPAFRALVRSVECRLFGKIGPLPEPVLDLGCGDGSFASVEFRGQPLFAGFDPDASCLREAVRTGAYRHLLASSASAMPFADECFKTVVSNSVLEHIPDLEAALKETHRVLCARGMFCFTVPSHRFGELLLGSTLCRKVGLAGAARAYAGWFNGHSAHCHTDPPETWIRRLEQNGFHVDHWAYYFSPAAHRVFDLAHYLSLPSLFSRKLTGQWILWPNSPARKLFERWFRPYAEQEPAGEGPYLFFQARKAGRR